MYICIPDATLLLTATNFGEMVQLVTLMAAFSFCWTFSFVWVLTTTQPTLSALVIGSGFRFGMLLTIIWFSRLVADYVWLLSLNFTGLFISSFHCSSSLQQTCQIKALFDGFTSKAYWGGALNNSGVLFLDWRHQIHISVRVTVSVWKTQKCFHQVSVPPF